MDPIIYVLDKNSKETIKIEEGFSSLVWTERYQEPGEFELDLPLSNSDFGIYRVGNYISFSESEESMIIESVESNDEDNMFKVSGRTLSSILDRRVNVSRILDLRNDAVEYDGKLSEIVQGIVYDEIINPKIQTATGIYGPNDMQFVLIEKVEAPERKIPNFIFRSTVSDEYTIKRSYNDVKTVLEILEDMCKPNCVGFRVIFDESKTFVMEFYEGADRTTSQTVNPPLLFNPVMENISNVNYFEDISEYRNMCMVYTDNTLKERDLVSDRGEDRISPGYLWIVNSSTPDITPTGVDRFETAIDVRSSVSYSELGENSEENGTWSFTSLLAKLEAAGNEEISKGDYDYIKLSEGTVDPMVGSEFGVDYNVGDLVDVTNDRGLVMTALIDEVVRSYDQNGYVVTPNFKSLEDYDYGDENE